MPLFAFTHSPILSFHSSLLSSATDGDNQINSSPKTFREAEVLGLRLMQEDRMEEALTGKPTGTT